MTNQQFRNLLNKQYPKQYTHNTGHRNKRWGNKKRLYGDYLWFSDRDMFNDMKRRHETLQSL